MPLPSLHTPLRFRRLAAFTAIAAAMVLATVLDMTPANGQRFSAPTLIPTGNDPGALLSADFTASGLPELLALDATALPAASSIRILVNNSGTFSIGSSAPAAGSAFLVMPMRPGLLPDLYWTTVSGSNVTLVRADAQADGSYAPGQTLTMFPLAGSATPRLLLAAGGLHVGFANAIVVADAANDQIYFVLPNPDGTYAVQPVYSYGGFPLIPGAFQILSADINGDSVPDVLVAGASGVQVFLASTSGPNLVGYGASTATYPCTGSVHSIALADMDADGHPDLLAEGANGRIDIYHGNADGTFAAASEVGNGADNAATGNGGHLVGSADLDADGLPDLVLANPLGISLLLGTGARSFRLGSIYAPGATPTHFVFTDLNGDGKPDIAFDSPTGVTVLYAQGTLPSVTSVTDLVTPIYYGQEIGYTNGIDAVVAVDPADPAPPPAGTTLDGGLIYVYLDGQLVCSLVKGATAPSGGPQRCNDASFMGFEAGPHTLVAAYQGNADYAPSTSATYPVVILPDDTAINLITSGTPAPLGSHVTFTATITAPYATPANGSVSFFDGATLLGTGALGGTNTAAFSLSTLSLGAHTITARYAPAKNGAGLYNFNPSDTSIAQLIQTVSDVQLTSSLNPSFFGQAVTFSAATTVGGAPAGAAGVITFADGRTLLASVALDAQGAAAYTTASLAVGSHLITATFTPGSSTTMGSSATLTQLVVPAPAGANDFSLTVTPSDLAIGVGNSASVTVTVKAGLNFLEPVALTCSDLPWESTCTFLAATIPGGGGSTQLAIHPEAPHNCNDSVQYFVAGGSSRFALVLGALTALLFGRRRRFRTALFAFTLAVLPMLGGCGLGGHCTDLGTRPGSYTFTVTGHSTGSAGISHSQTVRIVAFLYGEPH